MPQLPSPSLPAGLAGHASTPRLPAMIAVVVLLVGVGCGVDGQPDEGPYDLVLLNGHVIDPMSGLDEVRSVGIRDGRIGRVVQGALTGRDTIDASGMVVAPGFIDLHAHGQDLENNRAQARDGVTTVLELEVGTGDVDEWYSEREGESLLNFGVTIGHIPTRMSLMDDPGPSLPSGDAAQRPATGEEVAQVRARIEEGLRQGALGVGLGLQYTPAASQWEVLELFRAAAAEGVPVFVHKRHMGLDGPRNSILALQEVLAASAVTGARLHVHHVHSVGLRATPFLLQIVEEAREQGLQVTAEVYPYTAGMTGIESAIFDEGWQEVLGVGYGDLEWAATGERLTPETFRAYRATGGSVIIHFIPEAAMEAALAHPLAAVASDGRLDGGRGHPRSSGTYARVLGKYVREEGILDLTEAIRRMTALPASILEESVPAMARKGRVQEGADADLVVFDPETVRDRATYQEPALPSVGIHHVLVNGTFVLRDGALQDDVRPGRAVRRAGGS
jgi:N-acyl-D-aspartate/D-glutamate deacylase